MSKLVCGLAAVSLVRFALLKFMCAIYNNYWIRFPMTARIINTSVCFIRLSVRLWEITQP